MEALTLSRKDFTDAIDQINSLEGPGYTSLFEVKFPEGINKASVLEICRIMQAPSFENRVKLMRLCIAGKNVEVKCPNGDVETFCMTNAEDSFDAFPLFEKEPLALIAIADSVYGYIVKKSWRLSTPKEAAAQNAE